MILLHRIKQNTTKQPYVFISYCICIIYFYQYFIHNQIHTTYLNCMSKHDKTSTPTSIIASNIMKQYIHHNSQNQTISIFNQQNHQQSPLIINEHYHPNPYNNVDTNIINTKISINHNHTHNTQPPSSEFRLNIQYHHPLSTQLDTTSKLNQLKNHSKLKPLKQFDLSTEKERNSKILRHLKKNIFSVHFDKTKTVEINDSLFIKTQSNSTLKNKPQLNELAQNKSLIYNDSKNWDRKSLQRRQNISERQKSPSKVSVNFQLYFPKQKMRTTMNYAVVAKNHQNQPLLPRKSVHINGLQKQLFRIKKSTKSVSLHEENQKSIQSGNQTEIKRERKILQEEVLVSLRQNSTKKYIEKVEKFKKLKDNKIHKQPTFGLNVTQAEYHEFKLDSEGKRIKEQISAIIENQKHPQLKEKPIKKKIERETFKIDRIKLYSQKQNLMNLTVTQGQNLPLNCNTQSFIPQRRPILSIQKSQLSPQQKKSPSEHKLAMKNFVPGISGPQRKKSYFKSKVFEQPQSRQNNENFFKTKLTGMLNCLDIILNSYCCKIINETQDKKQKQPISAINKSLIVTEKYNNHNQNQAIRQLSKTNVQSIAQTIILKPKQRFFYFVGNGNNKNLIRSIMKKRGWWSETEKIENANFVWTQLKVTDILTKQPKMNQKLIQEPDSWHFKARQTQDSPLKSQKHKKSKVILESMQKYDKIFHKSMLPVYYKKLTQKQKQHEYLRSIKVPSIVHNHYDANYMLGNKKALFYNITQYCTYKKLSPNQFIPLTFHIESINSRQFKSWIKLTKKLKNTIWIVKPGENSNRGNGIFVEKDVSKIIQHIQKHANEKHSFIVQKYMKNIFLYNKRKFDIRVYMLMVTIGGVTKFYWYEEGYIRTSSEIYNAEDITDPFIHLTNDAIQAKNDTYSKYQKGNKVSYTEFQRYLDMKYPEQKYSVQLLVSKMKSIAELAVRSTYAKLDKAKKVNGFELFGLDFLVDKQFSPWLLEVNTNPCLELSSPVLERLIPRMLENMFRLTIDPMFRPSQSISKHSSYFLYDNLLQKNKFELIFDGLFDFDFQWEEICLGEKDLVYEDEDEIFESNGVEMDVVD